MPVNYLDIFNEIQTIAAAAPQASKELEQRRAQARNAFLSPELDQQALRDKLKKAAAIMPRLRCAIPTQEPINRGFPLPEDQEESILIAVDGSQINPSRHLPINYFLINIGIIQYPANPSQTPVAKRHTKLFSPQNFAWKNPNDNQVAYLRDLEERKILSAQVEIYRPQKNILTLTDGPLELWLRTDDRAQGAGQKEKLLDPYLDALLELKELNAITAGYVDKPRATMLVESLEIDRLAPDALNLIKAEGKHTFPHQFEGVTDGDLFAQALTNPGDRSAVFEVQFSEAKIYRAKDRALALHFFYLNVGAPDGSPYLARVEIPAWVATDQDKLNTLHANLYAQCGILGDVRYPYVLHRSHEEALVTFEDREEVNRLLLEEFAKHGIDVGDLSPKQSAKNLQTGRRRFSLGSTRKH